MSDKLDPEQLQRPIFQGGVPIVLADGQEWLFPRAEVYFVPDDNDVGYVGEWNFGPEYAALIDAAQKAETNAQMFASDLRLASYLLRLNYELSTEQLKSILRFAYGTGNEDYRRIREEVMDVAFGRSEAPKAEGGG